MALSSSIETITSGTVGKVAFDISFEGGVANPPGYLSRNHIFLWINDAQVTVGGGEYDYNSSGITFSWITNTRVQIAGYSPVLNDKIEFRRTLPTDKPVVNFVDRAGITEAQLDRSNLANLYAVHEIKDGFGTGTQSYYALAKLYANADEDYEVEAGQYSAKHWSLKSEGHADDSDTARVLAEAAQSGAEDAEVAALAAQAAAEAAQAAAENIDAYTKNEADAITDPIAATAAANASAISGIDTRLTTAEGDIITLEGDVATLDADKMEDVAQAWTHVQRSAAVALTSSSGFVDWDLAAQAAYGKLTLTEDTTINLPSNLADGAVFFMRILQNATGGWVVSYSANISFGAEGAPAMPATATTGQMILGFITDGSEVQAWECWRSE